MINKFSILQFYDSKTINLHSGINFIPTSVHLYGQDYSMRDVILSVLRPFIDSGTGTGIPQKHKYLTTIYPSLKIESDVTINNNEFIYHDKGKTRKDIQRYFEQLWKSRKTVADFPLILYYYKPKIVHKSNFYADINISTADTFNCRSSFIAYSGSLRDPFTVNTDFDLSYIFHKYMVALQAQHDSEIRDIIDYSQLYYLIRDIFPQFSFVFTENPNVARVNFDKYITDDDKANGGKVNLALKYEWQFTLLDFLVRAYILTLGDLSCTNGTVIFELPNLSEDDNDAFITALNLLSEYFLNVQFVVITDRYLN